MEILLRMLNNIFFGFVSFLYNVCVYFVLAQYCTVVHIEFHI